MSFTKAEFLWSVYMGVAFGLLLTLLADGSFTLFVAYFMAMFMWTLLSYLLVKALGKIDFYIKKKFWRQVYMNNFTSLENTMPPETLVHQLIEDYYVEPMEENTQQINTLADRAAKRQLEIEESLNPITSMFWTEFE